MKFSVAAKYLCLSGLGLLLSTTDAAHLRRSIQVASDRLESGFDRVDAIDRTYAECSQTNGATGAVEWTEINYYYAIHATAGLDQEKERELETLLYMLIQSAILWCTLPEQDAIDLGDGGRKLRDLLQSQQFKEFQLQHRHRSVEEARELSIIAFNNNPFDLDIDSRFDFDTSPCQFSNEHVCGMMEGKMGVTAHASDNLGLLVASILDAIQDVMTLDLLLEPLCIDENPCVVTKVEFWGTTMEEVTDNVNIILSPPGDDDDDSETGGDGNIVTPGGDDDDDDDGTGSGGSGLAPGGDDDDDDSETGGDGNIVTPGGDDDDDDDGTGSGGSGLAPGGDDDDDDSETGGDGSIVTPGGDDDDDDDSTGSGGSGLAPGGDDDDDSETGGDGSIVTPGGDDDDGDDGTGSGGSGVAPGGDDDDDDSETGGDGNIVTPGGDDDDDDDSTGSGGSGVAPGGDDDDDSETGGDGSIVTPGGDDDDDDDSTGSGGSGVAPGGDDDDDSETGGDGSIVTPGGDDDEGGEEGDLAPTQSPAPSVSFAPSSDRNIDGVTGQEDDDDDDDQPLFLFAAVPIAILAALMLLLARNRRNRNVVTADEFGGTEDYILPGTGDPPRSFHEGMYHYTRSGARYLSTNCAECHDTREMGMAHSFADLPPINENRLHDGNLSYSYDDLSVETELLEPSEHDPSAHRKQVLVQPSLNNLGKKSSTVDVHQCSSATCRICAYKPNDVSFIESPASPRRKYNNRDEDLTMNYIPAVYSTEDSLHARRYIPTDDSQESI